MPSKKMMLNSRKRLINIHTYRLFAVILITAVVLLLSSCSLLKPAETAPGGHGTLNLSDSGPITLDPAGAAEVGSASFIMQIFSGLVRLDEHLKIAPDIAESWDKSDDGKTYTFHLRRDVKFHDGKAVTANDFKYSWERALNPATRSLTAGTYLNDIEGAVTLISGQAPELSGVKVINDYTLEVKLTAPIPYFLEKMAYPTAFVVDRNNVASGGRWWQKPNGTGPFKLKQWVIDQTLVMERNPDYYGETAKLNQVVFKLYSGNSMQLYQTGDIDVTTIGTDYLGLATDPSNPVSKELKISDEMSIGYLGFNTTKPPFDDAAVRQAFSHAVDKDRVLTLAVDNIVARADGILPPDMPGYNPALQGLSFDVVKAQQLLAASKYGSAANLPPVVITTGGWGNNISGLMGGIIAEWQRNLGVEVTVRQLEAEVFSYVLSQEKDEMYDFGWIADYPDPQDFLDVLFRTGGQNNIGGYSNPELDALLTQAAIEPDNTLRMQMYRDAEQMIVNDAAILPLYFGRTYALIKPYVQGYELTPLGYALLNKVSVTN